jgi:hypothetical protein
MLQQGPPLSTPRLGKSPLDRFRRSVQQDHQIVAPHEDPVVGVHDRAAAGGNHLVSASARPLQLSALERPEDCLSRLVEYRVDRFSFSAHDLRVDIYDTPAEALRQPSRDNGLSGATEADEYDIPPKSLRRIQEAWLLRLVARHR